MEDNRLKEIEEALDRLKEEGLPDIKSAAEAGDPNAQYKMGYQDQLWGKKLNCLGVPQVACRKNEESKAWYEKAFKGYSKLAESGDIDAFVHLGELYRRGVPGVVERDLIQSARYFKSAADQGSDKGMRGMFLVCADAVKGLHSNPDADENVDSLWHIAEQIGLAPERNDTSLMAKQDQNQTPEIG